MAEMLTFYDMINDKSEPPEAIIGDGVLLDNTILMIIGQKKARKSFFALNLSMAIASGLDFAGFKIEKKSKVLHLSLEGGYFPNRSRIRKMSQAIELDSMKNINFVKKVNISIENEEDFEFLRGCIIKSECEVLVLDPLAKLHLQDENSSNSMALVFKKIRELMDEFGLSVIIIHHSGKNAGLGGRGSSFIGGEYDSAITITKKAADTSLGFEFRHVETPPTRKVIFNPETLWFESNERADFVINELELLGPISKSELIKFWEENGICKKTKSYGLINEAISNGLIKESEDGELCVV